MKNRKGVSNGNHTEIPIIVVESPPIEQTNRDLNGLPYVDEVDHEHDSEDEDKPSPLKEKDEDIENRRSTLRRNSVSLPSGLNALELEALREQYKDHGANQISEVGISNNASDTEEETDLRNHRDSVRIPLRNARKKSVINPGMLRVQNDYDSDIDGTSNGNSITSVNSLASLLREKMASLPQVLKKKKPDKEYKVKAFVGILFLVIVFLVVLAYVLYHQQVLTRAYFEKIKFNKAKRVIRIFNTDGHEIITGRLGTTINYDTVYPCLDEDFAQDGSICLEWMNRARLYLNFKQLNSEVRCYNIHWKSLNPGIAPTDCYDWSSTNGHWFGGGQTADGQWPLENGAYSFYPFITGKVTKNKWGNVLKRYFINSHGASITIGEDVPLYLSLEDTENGKMFCLQGRHDNFAYVNHKYPLPHLNYSLCTSTNMTRLHSYMSEKTLWDGLTKVEVEVINNLLAEPLWQITTAPNEVLTEGLIQNYTEEVTTQLGFLKQGHVLVNEFWQKQVGDFTLDQERFPTLKDTVDRLHRRGFRVVLSIQPFVSTESVNFAECVKKRLLVSERHSDRRIPALTRYKSVLSAGVLDVTNNRSVPWLLDKLKNLTGTYQIDAFYLDLGLAYNMPHYYQCEKPLTNPDEYKTILINRLQREIGITAVSSAIVRPRAPIFVSLPPVESSWKGLQSVIPTILNYGIAGYPFLIPGAVGGDFLPPGVVNINKTTGQDILLPDKELYMRWLQLATFLPAIRFTHLPTKFGDNKMVEKAKTLALLRTQLISVVFNKYARVSLDSGLPLIRPLWMLEPSDPSSHAVKDQFAIGEEIIAAPILNPGARVREVYLPAGVWKDGIDQSLRKGSRWIHDYKVGEDQIAYFVKMPDNTRF